MAHVKRKEGLGRGEERSESRLGPAAVGEKHRKKYNWSTRGREENERYWYVSGPAASAQI